VSRTIRIGSGSSWWGDRIEPARLNAERGALDYICFETMAEATISTAQLRARRDRDFPGYDTYLDDRMQAVLPGCLANGTKIVSNQGWINPEGAADRIVHWLREHGARGVTVAAVSGGMITDRVLDLTETVIETGRPTAEIADGLISAEVYLGAAPIVEALGAGASIVVTGRVADPSLFLAPMIVEFGWDQLDASLLGQGSGIGHLMECGAQVTGGYFSDPGFKDVPRPWDLAFPIAEVSEDGSAVICKVDGTGGAVNLLTVKEQLFYEVHDPASYVTPDVVVDFTTATLEEVGEDRVRVSTIGGKPRTPTFKVSIACGRPLPRAGARCHQLRRAWRARRRRVPQPLSRQLRQGAFGGDPRLRAGRSRRARAAAPQSLRKLTCEPCGSEERRCEATPFLAWKTAPVLRDDVHADVVGSRVELLDDSCRDRRVVPPRHEAVDQRIAAGVGDVRFAEAAPQPRVPVVAQAAVRVGEEVAAERTCATCIRIDDDGNAGASSLPSPSACRADRVCAGGTMYVCDPHARSRATVSIFGASAAITRRSTGIGSGSASSSSR
jgi:hypothetical protein